MDKIDEIEQLLRSDRAMEAKHAFSMLESQKSIRYLLLKGKLEQKFQQWNEAINTYSKIIQIDSGNSEAKNNLQIIQSILNFCNPEMFNP